MQYVTHKATSAPKRLSSRQQTLLSPREKQSMSQAVRAPQAKTPLLKIIAKCVCQVSIQIKLQCSPSDVGASIDSAASICIRLKVQVLIGDGRSRNEWLFAEKLAARLQTQEAILDIAYPPQFR